jgi:pimeloyl-ACP methyl ester carboxylesterase
MASHYYPWHHGEVHYQRRGLGDPLLLVHNIYPGASWEEYERNVDELARHFTVYAIDLLGFGESEMPRMKFTAQTYVDLIADFLTEEIEEPVHVMSAGLSCAYVTEVAARRAELFKKLVFLCPRSEPTGLDVPRWVAPLQHLMLSTPAVSSGYYETMTGKHELTTYLSNSFANAKAVTPVLVDRLHENARRRGAIHPFASLITGYLDSSLLASLPKVDLPLLLVWGRQARPTPVEHSVRVLSVARNSHLEVVENAGAWVHAEQSATVNRLVVEFLEREEKQRETPAAETA